MRYLDDLRISLKRILEEDKTSILLGEDLQDPYGGAFKVTKGISSSLPDKVLQAPISESGFIGISTGLAYMGFKPIVEIMFCDFITLLTDTLINTSSKLPWLTQGRIKGNITIRTPSGGGRGYGPIHSQNLEKIFFGWPNIKVVSSNIVSSPGLLFSQTFESDEVVKLFLENKIDYPKKIIDSDYLEKSGFRAYTKGDTFPTTIITNGDSGEEDVIICTYGAMVPNALEASYELLIEEELTTKIVIPTQISPIDSNTLNCLDSSNSKLVIVEEGYSTAGWSSHLLESLVSNTKYKYNLQDIKIVGPNFNHIPANVDDEKLHYPKSNDIIKSVMGMI